MKKQNVLKRTAQSIRHFFEHIHSYWELWKNRREYGAIESNATIREIHAFDRVQPGDLVYCEMPMSDWALADVPKGHRCRPYLILAKTEDGLIGCPSSHKRRKKISSWVQMELKPEDYDQFMLFGSRYHAQGSTFVDLSHWEEIPARKVLSLSTSLKESDRRIADRILRMVGTRKVSTQKRKGSPKEEETVWQISARPQSRIPGDIVSLSSGEPFLISTVDQDTAWGYRLSSPRQSQPDSKVLSVESINHYFFPFASLQKEKLEQPEQYPLISFCKTSTLLQKEKELKARKAQDEQNENPARKKTGAAPAFARKERIRITRQCGGIFQDFFSENEYVYMWTYKQSEKYLDLDEFYDGNVVIREIERNRLTELGMLIADDIFEEVLDTLVKRRSLSEDEAQLLRENFYNPPEAEEEAPADLTDLTEEKTEDGVTEEPGIAQAEAQEIPEPETNPDPDTQTKPQPDNKI